MAKSFLEQLGDAPYLAVMDGEIKCTVSAHRYFEVDDAFLILCMKRPNPEYGLIPDVSRYGKAALTLSAEQADELAATLTRAAAEIREMWPDRKPSVSPFKELTVNG